MFKLLSIPTLVLAGALSFLAVPSTEVAASECGRASGPVCLVNESCFNAIFFKMCSTRSYYYHLI